MFANPLNINLHFSRKSGLYRYSFQRQEVSSEYWEGAVEFKYRVEDARLGRFFSVDPLYAKYPWNSNYAFSENRLIDGVELEGTELLNSEDDRISITSGLVMLKLENFSDMFQSNFKKKYSGRNHLGQPTIGAAQDVFAFGILDKSNGKFEHPDFSSDTYKLMDARTQSPYPLKGQFEGPQESKELFAVRDSRAVIAPQPNGNGLYSDISMSGPSMGKVFARGWLALNAVIFVKQQMNAYARYDDGKYLEQSQKAFNAIQFVVNDALKKGYIQTQYQNLNDISIIMNLMLDGTGNEGLIKVNTDGSYVVNERAIYFNKISMNLLERYKTYFNEKGFEINR